MEDKVQQDFPIDWVEDDYVSRREFFKFMTLASGGLAVGSAGLAAWASLPRERRKFDRALIAQTRDLAQNAPVYFNYPTNTDPCVLLQVEGKLVAYSRRCTHLSCPVEFQPEKNRLYCPCHNGAFDLQDGHVLQGPPPRPLVQIDLEEVDGSIYAIGVRNA